MAAPMSQGSDDGLTADQLNAQYGASQDSEAGEATAPASNAASLRAKASPFPLQPTMPITITGASVPPLLRSPPSVRKQPTEGTAAADKMANMGIVGSVAAPVADASVIPPASVDAAKAGVQGLGGIGEEEDDEEEDYLTPEEKEQADHVKTVQAVIAAAVGAGFTFSEKTCSFQFYEYQFKSMADPLWRIITPRAVYLHPAEKT